MNRLPAGDLVPRRTGRLDDGPEARHASDGLRRLATGFGFDRYAAQLPVPHPAAVTRYGPEPGASSPWSNRGTR